MCAPALLQHQAQRLALITLLARPLARAFVLFASALFAVLIEHEMDQFNTVGAITTLG